MSWLHNVDYSSKFERLIPIQIILVHIITKFWYSSLSFCCKIFRARHCFPPPIWDVQRPPGIGLLIITIQCMKALQILNAYNLLTQTTRSSYKNQTRDLTFTIKCNKKAKTWLYEHNLKNCTSQKVAMNEKFRNVGLKWRVLKFLVLT